MKLVNSEEREFVKKCLCVVAEVGRGKVFGYRSCKNLEEHEQGKTKEAFILEVSRPTMCPSL